MARAIAGLPHALLTCWVVRDGAVGGWQVWRLVSDSTSSHVGPGVANEDLLLFQMLKT